MKKNIIITGTGRAGKSTLTRRLNHELGCFTISTDKIVTVLMRAYPELGINYHSEDRLARLAPYIGHYLGNLLSGREALKGINIVVEGNFDFDRIINVWNRYEIGDFWDCFHLIGLIYPNQTPERLFADIRKHDTEHDYHTFNKSDDELRSWVAHLIDYSRGFSEKYKKYNPIIYDVSYNRELVLDKAFNDIKSFIG